jgi:hypothetical protein
MALVSQIPYAGAWTQSQVVFFAKSQHAADRLSALLHVRIRARARRPGDRFQGALDYFFY